jgi:hypothetical protein
MQEPKIEKNCESFPSAIHFNSGSNESDSRFGPDPICLIQPSPRYRCKNLQFQHYREMGVHIRIFGMKQIAAQQHF